MTITHHSSISSISSITISSCVCSFRHGPLPSLIEQRVVGHVQVFDLHLVVVNTHGGQGAGHFLLLEDVNILCCKSGALLPSRGHVLKINRSRRHGTHLHIVPQLLVLCQNTRGVEGCWRDHHWLLQYKKHQNLMNDRGNNIQVYRPRAYKVITYTDPGMVHKLSNGHPLIGLCLQ